MDDIEFVLVALISGFTTVGTLWLQSRNETVRLRFQAESAAQERTEEREHAMLDAIWALEAELRLNATVLRDWKELDPAGHEVFESGGWIPLRTDAHEEARPYLTELPLAVSETVIGGVSALVQFQALVELADVSGSWRPDLLEEQTDSGRLGYFIHKRSDGLPDILRMAANDLRLYLTDPETTEGLEHVKSLPRRAKFRLSRR